MGDSLSYLDNLLVRLMKSSAFELGYGSDADLFMSRT